MQLSLPIKCHENFKLEELFVSSCNKEAYNLIMDENAFSNLLNERLLLVGEKKSGKTHLTKIWLKNNGLYINCAEQDWFSSTLLDEIIQCEKVVVENIDSISSSDSENLFHIINRCADCNIRLLMTSVYKKNFALRDLQSRINVTYTVAIQPPDDEIIELRLQKFCFDNKIMVNQEVIQYMKNNKLISTFNDIEKMQNLLLDISGNAKDCVITLDNFKKYEKPELICKTS